MEQCGLKPTLHFLEYLLLILVKRLKAGIKICLVWWKEAAACNCKTGSSAEAI
jgi:hypothetical protein